jgi:hypothetical protein
MTMKKLLLPVALLLLMAPGGCIFSPDEGKNITPINPVGVPFAGTEDQLMMNFRTAYEEMDFNAYQDILHPDFITILQPDTQEEFPDVGPTLDVAEELRIAERMFAGQPVTDPDGNLVPGITSIDFQTYEQRVTWATSQANDVIPNARFALYDVIFRFERPGYSTLEVTGQIKFYVAGRDSFHNGADRTFWQMIGQQDLTEVSANP